MSPRRPAPPAALPHNAPRRRWLAGVLAAGAAPAFLRHAVAQGQGGTPRFALGVASGFPRPDGMVLWTRLTGPALPERVPVAWEVAADEAFTQVLARGTETAEAAWGHSVHAEPAGLPAGRPCWYRFTALGDRSPTGRSRTAPAPDATAPLHLALASCQRYDHGHYAAWRQVVADAPDLVLFVGDYIYEAASRPDAVRRHEGTGPARTLAEYRARYATYQADPLLQAAHAAAPWVCLWDDHEVENDYAGLQSQGLVPEAEFRARRAAAYQAAWEHLPYPQAMRPQGPDMRIHTRLDWGRLARLITVDGRQHRDPQVCPKPGRGGSNVVTLRDCPALAQPQRSLLGAAQEAWLADSWDLQRPWNLLAQPTLMAPFAWTDPAGPEGGRWWTDGWDGYAPARARLLGAVADRKLPGAVVLGGDVHAHYAADLHHHPAGSSHGNGPGNAHAARGPVVASEFCGTSIASHGMPQDRVDAVRPLNPHVHYGRSDQRGYISLQVQERQVQARLMAVDNPLDPASPVREAARFAVELGRPGVQKA